MDTFGSRLRKLRKNKGLTQKKLGSLVGVSGPMVTQWEGDVALPKKDNADRLCSVLETSWEWLKDGSSNPPIEKGSYEVREPLPLRPVPLVEKALVVQYLAGDMAASMSIPKNLWGLPEMLGGSKHCFAIVEDSPGMSPRIMPGETVILDPSSEKSSEGEWAFNIDGQVVIGILNRTPRGLMLSFYNSAPGWEPVQVEHCDALGRVVATIPKT